VSASQVYHVVPWVFRCVRLRADAVSRLPFTITDTANNEATWPLQKKLPRLLWLSESSLCLDGAAYWYRQMALAGNLLDLKWLSEGTMKPETDSVAGLTGFTRTVGTQVYDWTPDKVVYLWLPDPNVEIGPGLAPAQAALVAASVGMNVDLYASAFFKRGAINPIIISLLGTPGSGETDRVQDWFKRVASGIRRAFAAIAVGNDVKITQLGSPINDLAMPELDKATKEKICAAFGIHPSMLAESSNFATAQETRLSFYQDTIIPEAGWIEQELNTQLFEPLGLRLTFHPETMDIMQTEETERAAAFASYRQGGLSASWAAQMLGLEAPQGHTWEELETAPDAPEKTAETMEPTAAQTKALQDDLRKWQRKSEKRGKKACEFDSEAIPLGISHILSERLLFAPATAFDFLKTIDESRLAAEEALAAAVTAELVVWWKRVTEGIQAGQPFDAAAFASGLQNAVDDVLANVVTEQAMREAVTIGIDFDIAAINHAAWEFARSYSYELVKGLTETTRKTVADAITKFIATPGMTNADLRALLEPAFGAVRAGKIGVTEVTRAYSAGTSIYQQQLAEMGLDFEKVWETSADEKVCPKCSPLNGKPESEWPDEVKANGGPPLHVGDRCHTTLRLRRKKAGTP
jgi:HK97 family phage portal protein